MAKEANYEWEGGEAKRGQRDLFLKMGLILMLYLDTVISRVYDLTKLLGYKKGI